MVKIEELERKDYEKLMSLKPEWGDKPLRTSAVQRAFGWGYNRTFRAIENALKKGDLIAEFDRGEITHYLFA